MSAIRAVLAAGLISALALVAPAMAEPVTARSGPAQLPTSGLLIDLPANPALSYKISGSWSLDDAAPSFDTRDVIDEFNATTGKLVAGNWVLVGYFTAGDCKAILGGEKLDRAWETTATYWGESWTVRGGVYTFDGELGRRPAAVLCRTNATGQSLLLYRYFVDQPETMTQADMLRGVTQAGVLESASKSYSAGRAVEILPLRRAETRNRGSTPANRTVTLKTTGLQVQMPDDGYVWLPEADEQVDWLTRMLPTIPEISIELMVAAGMTCQQLTAAVSDDKPSVKPRNVPAGWVTGPTILVEGETELTICRDSPEGARFVGVFLPAERTDLTPLHPLLIALGNARKP